MEVAGVGIDGQMARSHSAQHTCCRRKDFRIVLTRKPGEYGIEILKRNILFYLSTSLRVPSTLVRALPNTCSVLIIGLFVPKILFRQGGYTCGKVGSSSGGQ